MIGYNGHTYILPVDGYRDKIDINVCYLLISHNSFCLTTMNKKYPVLYPELNKHEHRYVIQFIYLIHCIC